MGSQNGHIVLFSVFIILFELDLAIAGVINSKLSISIAREHRGQLISYFTFDDEEGKIIRFELMGHPFNSSNLFLIPLDNIQNIFSSKEFCQPYFTHSISNVSLNQRTGSMKLGSFTGCFSTALVFVDKEICYDSKLKNQEIQVSVKITILNSNNEPLSGTLTGLRGYCNLILFAYSIAIAFALNSLRLCLCCTVDQHSFCSEHNALFNDPAYLRTRLAFSAKSDVEWDISRPLQMATCCKPISCKPIRPNGVVSRAEVILLWLLNIFLLIQMISASLFRWELHRLSSMDVPIVNPHPLSGANGAAAHFAELFAAINHYILCLLMLHIAVSTTRGSPLSRMFLEQRESPESKMDRPTSAGTGLSELPHPTFSIFSLFGLRNLYRFVFVLLCFQLISYAYNEGVYREPFYETPDKWPMEEQHAYWTGFVIPNSYYLSHSSIRTESNLTFLNWIKSKTLSKLYPMDTLLFLLRTTLGLMLSSHLLCTTHYDRLSRDQELKHKFGQIGFVWFLIHPVLIVMGLLLSTCIRYKVMVILASVAQLGCSCFILHAFSRQNSFWDVSSLSAFLPRLRLFNSKT